MKLFYAVLAVVGAVVPYAWFIPWVSEHGFDPNGFVRELFSTRIGAFFGLDVVIAALVLLAFVFVEGRRLRMSTLWAPVAATVLVGVSCGLPLFLWMREGALHQEGK